MSLEVIFFDLDDTLYQGNGMWQAIRERIGRYMHERLGLPWAQVAALRDRYYRQYGTTLRGLQAEFEVDTADYLAYVHDVPLERYLQPDPALRRVLESLPAACWVFTNADADHARRVLRQLAVADCFQGIVDVWAMGGLAKPQPEAYRLALRLAGVRDPAQAALVEDSLRNLHGAKAVGMITVLVGAETPDEQVDLWLPSVRALPLGWQGV